MNEKTAKLIRKFADRSGENERDIKRRWNVMNAEQRHVFRLQMQEQVGAEATAAGGDSEE